MEYKDAPREISLFVLASCEYLEYLVTNLSHSCTRWAVLAQLFSPFVMLEGVSSGSSVRRERERERERHIFYFYFLFSTLYSTENITCTRYIHGEYYPNKNDNGIWYKYSEFVHFYLRLFCSRLSILKAMPCDPRCVASIRRNICY